MFRQWIGIAAVVGMTSVAAAQTVPFTESYDADASNWRDATGVVNAAWVGAGGADGAGYITQALNFQTQTVGATPLLVRSDSAFGSSGGAFYGDWLGTGVSELRFSVRHNAIAPINVFARFATNVPGEGAIGLEFVPVFPNVWTPISIPIFDGNPQFISFEASDFATVFANIQRLQFGISVPAALAGQNLTFSFDFDEVGIVPEPSSLALLAAGGLLLAARRR